MKTPLGSFSHINCKIGIFLTIKAMHSDLSCDSVIELIPSQNRQTPESTKYDIESSGLQDLTSVFKARKVS